MCQRFSTLINACILNIVYILKRMKKNMRNNSIVVLVVIKRLTKPRHVCFTTYFHVARLSLVDKFCVCVNVSVHVWSSKSNKNFNLFGYHHDRLRMLRMWNSGNELYIYEYYGFLLPIVNKKSVHSLVRFFSSRLYAVNYKMWIWFTHGELQNSGKKFMISSRLRVVQEEQKKGVSFCAGFCFYSDYG